MLPLSAVGVNRLVHKLLPPPFRINCRPERRERDAELPSDVTPPNRPPSRLPRDRALRAGEHKPIFFRWTLLCRPLMAGRSISKDPCLHRKNAPNPKPRVKVACLAVRLLHVNNRCSIQQLLQRIAQECRPRDWPYSGLPPPPMASQARLAAHRPFLSSLSPVLKRLRPTAIPVSGQSGLAKGVNLLRKTASL